MLWFVFKLFQKSQHKLGNRLFTVFLWLSVANFSTILYLPRLFNWADDEIGDSAQIHFTQWENASTKSTNLKSAALHKVKFQRLIYVVEIGHRPSWISTKFGSLARHGLGTTAYYRRTIMIVFCCCATYPLLTWAMLLVACCPIQLLATSLLMWPDIFSIEYHV